MHTFAKRLDNDRRHHIAVRAYYLWLAGIGADDLDRWLTAEMLDREPAPESRKRSGRA